MNDLEQRIEATVNLLKGAAERAGMIVTADLRVSEVDAAQLIGYSARTLANLRQFSNGPDFYRRTAGGKGRVSYRLQDLGRWIEETRNLHTDEVEFLTRESPSTARKPS